MTLYGLLEVVVATKIVALAGFGHRSRALEMLLAVLLEPENLPLAQTVHRLVLFSTVCSG